jgi:hypothetical protein
LIPTPRGAVKPLPVGLLVAPSSDPPEIHRISSASTSDRAARQLEGSCIRHKEGLTPLSSFCPITSMVLPRYTFPARGER